MKKITISCRSDGTSNVYNSSDNLLLSNENESVEITIEFNGLQPTYLKRADIYVDNDQTLDYTTAELVDKHIFNLTSEHLKQGRISIQPIAYEAGDIEYSVAKKEKWQVQRFNVEFSINASESTVNVADTMGYTLQTEIDALELDVSAIESDIVDIQADLDLISIPRFNDIVFELTPTRQGSNTKPDYDFTNVGLLFPQNLTTEIAYITVQLPHSWLVGSTIYPHIHVVQSADQQAVFKMDYKWYNIGDTVPATWTTYTMGTYAETYTSGSISQILHGIGIDGTGKTISSILKIKLYRDDNVYTGDILADQFDIHIQVDGFGSQEQYIKT